MVDLSRVQLPAAPQPVEIVDIKPKRCRADQGDGCTSLREEHAEPRIRESRRGAVRVGSMNPVSPGRCLRSVITKQWMRHETLGKLSFDSHYLGRLIDVFLTTHIASDFERCGDRGARSDGVGLGE